MDSYKGTTDVPLGHNTITITFEADGDGLFFPHGLTLQSLAELVKRVLQSSNDLAYQYDFVGKVTVSGQIRSRGVTRAVEVTFNQTSVNPTPSGISRDDVEHTLEHVLDRTLRFLTIQNCPLHDETLAPIGHDDLEVLASVNKWVMGYALEGLDSNLMAATVVNVGSSSDSRTAERMID